MGSPSTLAGVEMRCQPGVRNWLWNTECAQQTDKYTPPPNSSSFEIQCNIILLMPHISLYLSHLLLSKSSCMFYATGRPVCVCVCVCLFFMRAKERWRQTDNKKILNCLCFEPRYEHACTQMPTNIDVCRRACVFVCLLGGKKYCSVVSLHNPHSLPLFCQSQLTNFYLQVQYTHTRPPIHLFSVPVFN